MAKLRFKLSQAHGQSETLAMWYMYFFFLSFVFWNCFSILYFNTFWFTIFYLLFTIFFFKINVLLIDSTIYFYFSKSLFNKLFLYQLNLSVLWYFVYAFVFLFCHISFPQLLVGKTDVLIKLMGCRVRLPRLNYWNDEEILTLSLSLFIYKIKISIVG